MTDACPFCSVPTDQIFYADALVVGIWDRYPVSPGHALLVTKRHVASWFEATDEEQQALTRSIAIARAEIEKDHTPHGYNLGINVGEPAGQTIFHLHAHVIPRYKEDVSNPRGGVRNVIAEKADYLTALEDHPLEATASPHDLPLVHGEADHLLPHLLAHLDSARTVDIAVAFVLPSGVAELEGRLRDSLDRGCHIRFLTGDYLVV